VWCNTTELVRLNPSQTRWYSIYVPQSDGRLSWPWCWIYTEMVYLLGEPLDMRHVSHFLFLWEYLRCCIEFAFRTCLFSENLREIKSAKRAYGLNWELNPKYLNRQVQRHNHYYQATIKRRTSLAISQTPVYTARPWIMHCTVCLFTSQLSLVLTVPSYAWMARLSWPDWPIMHWDGLPTCQRSSKNTQFGS